METIAEVLESTAYFLLNPFAWFAAVAFAQRTGILRVPVIAAVATQLLMAGLLIGLVALSNKPFPAHYIVFLLLIPAVLSGLILSGPVLMITKRRRFKRFLASRRASNISYPKHMEQSL